MIVTTITSVRRATRSTRIVRLQLGSGRFTYRAGQAAEIGPAGANAMVPYSMACAPDETHRGGYLEFLVKIDDDERWGEGFDPLRRGQQIRVRGPFGRFTFPDAPAERRFLFIAGGTGIAPLRAILRQVRGRVPGIFRVLYSARTPLDFAYRRELCGMARRREIELQLTATGNVPDTWRWSRGRIALPQLEPLIDDRRTLCFVCGPASMVDDVPRMLQELGIERSRIRLEEW